jgi:pimeloyl-ACP methyl ester carboxylesterase
MSGFDAVGRTSGPGFSDEPVVERGGPIASPAPSVGWTHPRAPNGRVLPFDTTSLPEDDLLRPGGKAALYALGGGPADFHPEREPLVLVHGIQGDPKVLQGVIDRFKTSDRYQLYVLCYDDFHGRRTSLNGKDFAEELASLQARTLGPGRDVSIVAHSMGGIVTREALNQTDASKLGNVRVFAADTPWSGYGGPSDRGLDGFMMGFVRPFMPDGLEDMRAKSTMFEKLFEKPLPDNISVHMAAAVEGKEVEDYTEGALQPLAGLIAARVNDDAEVKGEPRLMNYYRAMLSSAQYPTFRLELEDLSLGRRVTEADVRGLLEKHFPRFAGNHDGMLKPQASGASYLDFLSEQLKP